MLVTLGTVLSLPSGVEEEEEEKKEEQRSLTGQKAEPLGMKFTLFLSGQEKRGKPFDLQDLHERTIREHKLRNCHRNNSEKDF